jgi:hypothetical protein
MKIRLVASAIAIAFIHIPPAQGDIIFSQDFSESTKIEDYANLTSPDSGQWNRIVGGTIQDGWIKFQRGSYYCGFTRSTDLSEPGAHLSFSEVPGCEGSLERRCGCAGTAKPRGIDQFRAQEVLAWG